MYRQEDQYRQSGALTRPNLYPEQQQTVNYEPYVPAKRPDLIRTGKQEEPVDIDADVANIQPHQ